MLDEEIKIKCVNGGKPFKLPCMTVERHEEWLEEITRLEKEAKAKDKDSFDKEKFDRYATKMLVLKTLKYVDKNITIENINGMHPSDFVYISNRIWDTGREIRVKKEDFQIS